MSNKAKNIGGVKWKTSSGVTFFSSTKRCYGIENNKGQLLSSDGRNPMRVGTLRTAKEMAPYADEFKNHTWIDVVEF